MEKHCVLSLLQVRIILLGESFHVSLAKFYCQTTTLISTSFSLILLKGSHIQD